MLQTIILFVIFVIVKSNKCVQRSFGPDAIVCVCNSTYCDTVDNQKLLRGQFQLYTSTKSGERLQLTVGNSITTKLVNGILLTVNSHQKYQNIHGFGGTLTDAAVLNINTLSNATQQNLLESYFGSPNIGMSYTHINVPMANTDFSTRPYTYDDTPDDVTLNNFSLVEEDDYKIKYLHQIKRIMPDPDSLRIFCVPWTAPTWMKTINSPTFGSLKREYYQTYANYFKKFLDAYKERGINFWGVIPQHNPTVGLNKDNYFTAMAWQPNAYATWSVNYLALTLSKARYNPVYIAYDDSLSYLLEYIDDVFRNKKARKLFGGISVSGYFGEYSSLTETHDRYPEKFLLVNEVGTGIGYLHEIPIGVQLGSWDRGEYYALHITHYFAHWVIGWIDFNLALNQEGGPNWTHNYIDASIIVIPESDEFYKQPQYYAIAHFSNFVPRHSHRILSTGFENNENITAIAFLTPNEEIVVVTINTGDEPINVTIKDENTDGRISLQLAAKSFNTLLYLAHQ